MSESRRTPARRTSMRRHYLSRSTWRPLCGVNADCSLSALRAMLLSALSVSPLFGGSVHRMRSVFSTQSAAIFLAVSPPRRGWTKFAMAQSPLEIRSVLEPVNHCRPEGYCAWGGWPSHPIFSEPHPCEVRSIYLPRTALNRRSVCYVCAGIVLFRGLDRRAEHLNVVLL